MPDFRVSCLRKRLAALGCILLGLPGLYGFPPLIAADNPVLTLRIDLGDRSLWRVEWRQVQGTGLQRRDRPAEPFLREGLARIERFWPEGPQQAAFGALTTDPLHEREVAPRESRRQGAFRLRPLAAGQGLDQTFAFPPQMNGGKVVIEIIGHAEGISVEHSGLQVASPVVPGHPIRLSGQIATAQHPSGGMIGALRLHLSGHASREALAEAIRASFDPVGPPIAGPPIAGAPSIPDRADLALLMASPDLDRPARSDLARKGVDPDDPALAPLARALMLQGEIQRRGWSSHLVLSNRRPLLALPMRPAFLFDTVMVEVPQARLLLDPSHRMLLDSEVPHPDLGGKAALVLAASGPELRAFRTLRPADQHVVVRAELGLDHHGAISGHSRTEVRRAARPMLAQLTRRLGEEPEAMQELLRRQGLVGTARLGASEQDDPSLSQHLEFRLENPLDGTAPLPVHAGGGPRLFRAPLAKLLPALQAGSDLPLACQPMRLEQDIVMHMPDQRSLLDVPPDLQVEASHARYQAIYRLEPTHLRIRRQLELDPPGALCSAEMIREMAPVLRAAGHDLDRPLNLRLSP
ncbi:MAG: hypothetical protein IOC64_09980 [Methylobacterium sp.]|nr:hypothetical protein [Methylobacterium sp.]MCA3599336.1 hypothetical protein [Methylobacterium sp.]MCA3606107.1 hypothetical protein [Methylobacterium sp.]MCA3609935.1 hypothetical protein [Methylobacterium sp.]MCA3619396.1 hypothetical protein [Methylobacterium sp.]